jgi:hypothetical protein
LQLLLLVVLTAILFGSLEALREGGGQLAAVLLTVGLAVSLLPILLRVLRPVRRDATMQPRDPQLWVTLLGLILSPPLWFFSSSLADHVRRRSVGSPLGGPECRPPIRDEIRRRVEDLIDQLVAA